MRNLLFIFFLLPIVTFAQNSVKIDDQLKPFIGNWESSTKDYKVGLEATHEPKFPMNKLVGDSNETTEVLFFDFYFYDKNSKEEIKIKSSLNENPRSFTAFISDDNMPNILLKFRGNPYQYKLKVINENEIEIFSNEKPRHVIDFATKESRVIPKESSPIPDRIVLKRVKN